MFQNAQETESENDFADYIKSNIWKFGIPKND